MICRNCNRSVPDKTRFCPYCGAAAEATHPANGYDFGEEKTISGINSGFGFSPSASDLNEERTVSGFNEFYPAHPVNNEPEAFDLQPELSPAHGTANQLVDNQPVGTVQPRWENPFPPEAYPDQPLQQYVGAPAGQEYQPYNQPYTPPIQNDMSVAPLQKQRSGGKIIAAAVTVTVVAILAFVTFMIVYNSDWFKLAQAESAMLDGKYTEGLNKIGDIDTDRAKAVRGFADVMKLRDKLKEQYGTDTLCDMDSDAYKTATDYKQKLTDFSKDYKPAELTEKLGDLYEDYAKAAGDVSSLLYDSDISTEFVTAQNTFTEYAKRKHGEKFTIGTMTAVRDATQSAYDNIGSKLMNTDAYKSFTSSYSGKAVDTMSEFYGNINTRIAQDNHEITDADKYENKELRYQNSDTSYKPYVADGLEYADSQENITSNAQKLIASLDCAMLINSFDSAGEE